MLRIQSALPKEIEECATQLVDVGFTVHNILGPGFKEKIYEKAFCLELELRKLKFECEKPIQVKYKHWQIPGQKVDLIVEGLVLVELKAVPRLRPIHRRQALSYLRTMGLRLALLMNFNREVFHGSVKRVVL